MFANLGVESEHKDAHRHPTGRRHAPREMTTDAGVPTFGSPEAANTRRASDQLREQQVQKANVGPSFMDQMFDQERKRSEAHQAHAHGTGVNRPANTPKDQLNLFAWDTHGSTAVGKATAPYPPARSAPGGAAAAAAAAAAPPPVADAEARRSAEARKFEQNSAGHFLAFSGDRKAPVAQHPGKRMNTGVSRQPQQGLQAPFATDDSANNQRSNGDNAAQRRGKKAAPAVRQGDGGTVQGFKGMGDQCTTRPTGRKVGKAEPSQVFLPFTEPQQANQPPPQKYVPQRPVWLQNDDDVAPQQQIPSQQQQQRSVRFQEGPTGQDVPVFEDERYYVDREQAYLQEQQQEPGGEQERRVLQFQRRNRAAIDNNVDEGGAYYGN